MIIMIMMSEMISMMINDNAHDYGNDVQDDNHDHDVKDDNDNGQR